MIPIALTDIGRPMLPAALAARGMRVALPGEAARARVARFATRDLADTVVEVSDAAALIEALDAGAGDAVLASDSDGVVAVRLEALIRRAHSATIVLGDLAVDTVGRQVTRGGRRVSLLAREYALLLHFARAPHVIHDRTSLRAAVWGLDFDPGTKLIEVHMSRLRAKLDRGTAPILLTEKGRGYRLVPVEPAPAAASG